MATAVMNHRTKVSTWGNSDAIRIPRKILDKLGIHAGDDVDVIVNERNNIEILCKDRGHRNVRPARGITFETLFAGYEPNDLPSDPWPDEDLIGAEAEAWAR